MRTRVGGYERVWAWAGANKGGQKAGKCWQEREQQQQKQLQQHRQLQWRQRMPPSPFLSLNEDEQQPSRCIPSSPPPPLFLNIIL